MNKWELIEITLDQLITQWNTDKDFFSTDTDEKLFGEDKEQYICWEPTLTPDEEEAGCPDLKIRRCIIITYMPKLGVFNCYICPADKETPLRRKISNSKPENVLRATRFFIPIRSLYRKFRSLHLLIDEYKRRKLGNKYLSNLCDMFPGTLDEHILGSIYGQEEED